MTGLWRHPQFLKLWAGQTISVFGDQASILALPLTAVLLLSASPLEMGLLGASQTLPWLVVGLLAGAWVDRLPQRPILIAADLGAPPYSLPSRSLRHLVGCGWSICISSGSWQEC